MGFWSHISYRFIQKAVVLILQPLLSITWDDVLSLSYCLWWYNQTYINHIIIRYIQFIWHYHNFYRSVYAIDIGIYLIYWRKRCILWMICCRPPFWLHWHIVIRKCYTQFSVLYSIRNSSIFKQFITWIKSVSYTHLTLPTILLV